ncbi:hypothetical protein PAXRUDRAFT_807399 [Paxillus rubicundulus Ve08.2h10]|uniref:Uncharacterized protein n=1 Tax=Paxillus rubicundulus Ve08.2h10 TaxID=930991 RepID=A0A0D0DBU9_9AGAM|nr:hypothetical protein PAXRUDRAFT_807399 [Paxillus rubicundulus Ve08.2h10]
MLTSWIDLLEPPPIGPPRLKHMHTTSRPLPHCLHPFVCLFCPFSTRITRWSHSGSSLLGNKCHEKQLECTHTSHCPGVASCVTFPG